MKTKLTQDFFIRNRKKYYDLIDNNSITILFSGYALQKTADQDYPFEVNKNFYYLTGINQENVTVLLMKSNDQIQEYLFIEENDPILVKWVGKKLTIEEAKTISGIQNILYLPSFKNVLFSKFNATRANNDNITKIYFDLERRNDNEYTNKALRFANEFKEQYPEINIENNYNKIVLLRMKKEPEEISLIKESVDTTKNALENVMKNLQVGLYEYQIETFYDSYIKYHEQKDSAFTTICATGKNATILHYVNNNTKTKDNDLILFDLGCRTNFYISDISRTYPVNGKFSERQKQIYEIVLNCNKKCIEFLKPGITWAEYNQYANSLLIEGLKKIKLINSDDELINYYWHSIGHSTGLDTHDPSLRNVAFVPGMIMTVEPGLYLEKEGIGIRIEDNVLITEDGCINLSKDIIKEVADIEKFMKK